MGQDQYKYQLLYVVRVSHITVNRRQFGWISFDTDFRSDHDVLRVRAMAKLDVA